MKALILAGGFGTRLSEYTDLIPKPMVTIGGKPIIWHILNHYSRFGVNEFYIALGYKAHIIKEYFLDYTTLNSDFTIDLSDGSIVNHGSSSVDWKVTLVDTGLNSMTGGRIKRMQSFIGNEPFLVTYGDGISDINISHLIDFHRAHKKLATVSSVRPSARFGELVINDSLVTCFQEKPQLQDGWINGGFFVFNPEIFDYLEDDSTVLEKEPLESLAKSSELMAFEHHGFWQCMDTKRDRDYLESLISNNTAPWLNL